MLRFIISRQWGDGYSGANTQGFETVDIDVPELESILCGGGHGPSGHDLRSLAGVEVLPTQAPNTGEAHER